MKHPVLTRFMAIILAILSAVMLCAGAIGISKAENDREDTLADAERVRGRIDEYNTVTQALEGTISYEEAKKQLDQRQEQHDSDASQHRSDLAMYTATKGGVASGQEALDQAQDQIANAWTAFLRGEKQYKEQKAAFDEGYQKYLDGKAQIEAGYAQYEAFKASADSLALLPASIQDITVIPTQPGGTTGPTDPTDPTDPPDPTDPTDPPDPTDPTDPTDHPDPTDPTDPTDPPDPTDPANTKEPAPQEPAPEEGDQGGQPPANGDENDSGALQLTACTGGARVAASLSFGGGFPQLPGGIDPSQIPPEPLAGYADREQTIAALKSVAAAYEGVEAFAAGLEAQSSMLPEEMTGMLETLNENIGTARQSVNGVIDTLNAGSGPVADMELIAAWTTYNMTKTGLDTMVDAISGQLAPVLEETKATLDAGKAELDQLGPQLEQGRAAIEEAGKAIEEAREQLNEGSYQINEGQKELEKTLADLAEQAEELKLGKAELDQEAQELDSMAEEARQQKDLEARQTSLKIMLLDRDGIEQRVDGGMELIESAGEYVGELESGAERDYSRRLTACVLMIAGGLAGILGIPAAFEKTRGRLLLIAPVLICLGCAAGAECVFEFMGRGSSYSAIFAGIFAVIQLIIILPKQKKPASAG